MRETAESPKETIIVVHGTWAAPAAKELRWWQPVGDSHVSEGFVAKLDAELRQRGSTARCWAHCKDGSEIFHWSGENNWVDRAKASSAFRTYLHKLQSDGWTCHIVAHSHGGNVVLDTLSSQATQQLVPPGKLVTIGSPFLDVMPPIFRKSKFIMTLMGWTAFIVSLLVFLSVSYLMIDVIDNPYFSVKDFVKDWTNLGASLVLAVSFSVFVFIIYRGLRKPRTSDADRQHHDKKGGWRTLVISSAMDEAWQATHYMRNADSPLSPRESLFRYVVDGMIADHRAKSEISRIHGAIGYADVGVIGKIILLVSHVVTVIAIAFTAYALYVATWLDWSHLDLGNFSVIWQWLGFVLPLFLVLFFTIIYATISGRNFLSAYWSPFRWCARWFGSLKSAAQAAATYVVRRRAWPLLQALALGLESYRYPLPQVERNPTHFAAGEVTYEDLPADVEERALSAREDWIARHLGNVSETFSKMLVTSADINALLRLISVDQSLVHGTYYTDEACIERIADWIAADR